MIILLKCFHHITIKGRQDMIKLTSKFAEKAKLNIRKVRKDSLDEIKLKKENMSEDDFHKREKEVI